MSRKTNMKRSFFFQSYFLLLLFHLNISQQMYLFSNLFHRETYQIDTILMRITIAGRVRTENREEGLYTLPTLLLQSLTLGGPLRDCRNYETKTTYRTIRDGNHSKVLLTKMKLNLIITHQGERIKDADHPMGQINERRLVHHKSYRCP